MALVIPLLLIQSVFKITDEMIAMLFTLRYSNFNIFWRFPANAAISAPLWQCLLLVLIGNQYTLTVIFPCVCELVKSD